MRYSIRQRLALVSALSVVLAAHATPVTLEAEDINFTGGGTVSGSFTYNPDTNVFSDVDLVTTPGGGESGASYVNASGATIGAPLLLGGFAFNELGTPSLTIFLSNAYDLDSTTGELPVIGVVEDLSGGNTRFANSGYLEVVPEQSNTVPEPGSIALVGMSLAGLGYVRRRTGPCAE